MPVINNRHTTQFVRTLCIRVINTGSFYYLTVSRFYPEGKLSLGADRFFIFCVLTANPKSTFMRQFIQSMLRPCVCSLDS